MHNILDRRAYLKLTLLAMDILNLVQMVDETPYFTRFGANMAQRAYGGSKER